MPEYAEVIRRGLDRLPELDLIRVVELAEAAGDRLDATGAEPR